MKTLIYSENTELSLQLLGKAIQLSGAGVSAVAVDHDQASALVGSGAAKAYLVKDRSLDALRAGILDVVARESPDLVMFGSTKRERELAPRVAAALKAGYSGDCFEAQQAGDGFAVKRLAYGGSTIASATIKGKPAIISVPPRSFQKPETKGKQGEIIKLNTSAPASRVKVLESRPKRTGDAGLESAKIIVSAGRGFKKREDLKLLEELASVLGAKMGCSRPVSADLGWMDQWVGISGKKVAPRLYVACGISGTIQHAAGIRDSKLIVSINSDEAAGIHELSDYSIVGDLYAVLPALTKALRERAK
ncbi:MAG: electron transfer flavoprotein subunit alpha/FixB family protein [Candidatus Bathyarchaeota archaeon]|nr:electron transfer flavoprotein subunit alpha/FixB family protein [Candidatus Bathyarchaeota archaeon]